MGLLRFAGANATGSSCFPCANLGKPGKLPCPRAPNKASFEWGWQGRKDLSASSGHRRPLCSCDLIQAGAPEGGKWLRAVRLEIIYQPRCSSLGLSSILPFLSSKSFLHHSRLCLFPSPTPISLLSLLRESKSFASLLSSLVICFVFDYCTRPRTDTRSQVLKHNGLQSQASFYLRVAFEYLVLSTSHLQHEEHSHNPCRSGNYCHRNCTFPPT